MSDGGPEAPAPRPTTSANSLGLSFLPPAWTVPGGAPNHGLRSRREHLGRRGRRGPVPCVWWRPHRGGGRRTAWAPREAAVASRRGPHDRHEHQLWTVQHQLELLLEAGPAWRAPRDRTVDREADVEHLWSGGRRPLTAGMGAQAGRSQRVGRRRRRRGRRRGGHGQPVPAAGPGDAADNWTRAARTPWSAPVRSGSLLRWTPGTPSAPSRQSFGCATCSQYGLGGHDMGGAGGAVAQRLRGLGRSRRHGRRRLIRHLRGTRESPPFPCSTRTRSPKAPEVRGRRRARRRRRTRRLGGIGTASQGDNAYWCAGGGGEAETAAEVDTAAVAAAGGGASFGIYAHPPAAGDLLGPSKEDNTFLGQGVGGNPGAGGASLGSSGESGSTGTTEATNY